MCRFRLLWVLGALVLGSVLFWFFSSRNDELDFLRRFDPDDRRHEIVMSSSIQIEADGSMHSSGTGRWCRELVFPKRSPELIQALKKYCRYDGERGRIHVELPSGRKAFFYWDTSTLVMYDEPAPSWLDLKLDSLKRTFHMRPNLVFARDGYEVKLGG